MNPASAPTTRDRRLLHLDPRSGALRDGQVRDLKHLVRPGDLVVVNDAATLPASFAGRAADGRELEVRLAGANEDGTWSAVLFGAGDWRQRTEDRPAPPALAMEEDIAFGLALSARVMDDLRGAGAIIASVTHAAGLSSTGDPAIDAALPLSERYDVPEATVQAVRAARANGGRVLAVGTTVVRALEGARADGGGQLEARTGWTAIRIGATTRPRVVDALFTGLHQRGEPHFELLRAFAPDQALTAALEHAGREGYLTHEFGDAMVVI